MESNNTFAHLLVQNFGNKLFELFIPRNHICLNRIHAPHSDDGELG